MKRGRVLGFLVVAATLFLQAFPAAATVLEVCKSGCTFLSLQGAIKAAAPGDEVVVGPGVWNELINFKGKNIVVRSLDGPGSTTIDGGYRGPTVSFVSGEGRGAVLEGFTVTGGRYQGGIYVGGQASPTIRRCIVAGNLDCGIKIWGNMTSPSAKISECLVIYNYSQDDGGGIRIQGAPEAEVLDSVIAYNSTKYYGGGLFISNSAGPTVRGSTIYANTAGYSGGGIACAGNVLFDGNVVTGNTAQFRGGGVFLTHSASTLTNCLISGNRDRNRGGGVYVDDASTPKIVNCTVVRNIADRSDGAGILCNGGSTTVVNSIIRDNRAGGTLKQLLASGGTITASFSNVQGGWAGTGNINADPLFAAPAPVGNKAIGYGDYHLLEGSPCIDAGTDSLLAYLLPVTDIDGEARPLSSARDIGADEVGSSPSPIPVVNVGVLDGRASEPGADRGKYAITTDSIATRPMVFFYKMGGTTGNGSDYIRFDEYEVMPAGYDGLLLPLRPKDDTLREGTETAIMRLRPAMGYRVGTFPSGTVNIKDND